jgi:hypothetical protein
MSKRKIIGAILSLLGLVSLAAVVGSTGAYFSDTNNGKVSGTVGSIKVATSGGTGADTADFTFTDLLPGTPQSATVNYQNNGRNPQDVWVVFPNADALHSLNQLGTYGEVHIAANGVEKFASQNLNDGYACGTPGNPGVATVCPVPQKLKLASNVAPGAGGNMTFAFNYASKLVAGNIDGATGPAWNTYAGGDGLPYQIVATQVGQTP